MNVASVNGDNPFRTCCSFRFTSLCPPQELQLILTDYVEDYTDQFIAAVATSVKLGGSEEPDYAPGMLPVVVRKFAILLNTIDIVILRFFENLLNQILSISDAANFLWTISDSHTYNHMSPIWVSFFQQRRYRHPQTMLPRMLRGFKL